MLKNQQKRKKESLPRELFEAHSPLVSLELKVGKGLHQHG